MVAFRAGGSHRVTLFHPSQVLRTTTAEAEMLVVYLLQSVTTGISKVPPVFGALALAPPTPVAIAADRALHRSANASLHPPIEAFP